MPDRYANGDPSNDRGGRRRRRATSPASTRPTPGWFHGGDLRGPDRRLHDPSTASRGSRTSASPPIWVTPPVRQKAVQGVSAAYHGYWGLDFTHVDPHLGTDADFAAFVDCAHRLGLKVYLDVVVNHTADVIQLSDSRYVVDPTDAPTATATARASTRRAYVRPRRSRA